MININFAFPREIIAMRTILFILLITLGTHAFSHHEPSNRNLENGYHNYQDHCASCHGVNLEGQAIWRIPDRNGTLPEPPHDESGHTWHHETDAL